MLPEKHFKDLESSSRRQKYISSILHMAVFLVSFLLLGPVIHELAHMTVLELGGCEYIFQPGLGLQGFSASVKPLCTAEDPLLAVFYSSGFLSTLIIGVGLGAAAGKTSRPAELSTAASGILVSILASVLPRGDLESLASITGIPGFADVSRAVLVVSVAASTIWILERQLQKGRNGADTRL